MATFNIDFKNKSKLNIFLLRGIKWMVWTVLCGRYWERCPRPKQLINVNKDLDQLMNDKKSLGSADG